MLSRARRLGTRHHHHLRSCSSFYSTTALLEGPSSPTPVKESRSPAAIVSLVHQHIAFRTRPWELGEKQKERTTLNTTHRESANPISPPGFVKPLRGRSTSIGLPLKRPPRIPTSTTADLEKLADDLEAYAMAKTTSSPEPLPRIYGRQSLRPRLLAILAHTQDATHAWAAYRSLLILPRSAEKPAPKVPFPHRHRLLRLLAAAPPRRLRPRGRFAQVFSVVRALHEAGGIVQRWEWNLLLDCAGKEGWRCPRQEHFRGALAILAEMRARGTDGRHGDPGDAGGTMAAMGTGGSFKTGKRRSDGNNVAARGAALTPDIFSYTILLAHAVRSRAPMAVRHAARLLVRAGLTPGVHAHTALLCFFARRGDLPGVRDSLFRLRRHMQNEDDGDSGSDGSDSGLTQASFNAVLWAYAYNGRFDVAQAMYHIVRGRADIATANGCQRCLGEEPEEQEELEEFERVLAEREMIVIARDVVPDAATYHSLIQAYAYRGDLRACLETLSDMLSAPASSLYHHHHHHHDEHQAKEECEMEEKDKERRGQFIANLTAFRAIFLGFARHGVAATASNNHPLTRTATAPTPTIHEEEEEEKGGDEWTLSTLEALFERFLDIPRDTPLREPTLFWLVSAYLRTSTSTGTGSHHHQEEDSSRLLRSVFERVEARFGPSALRLTQGDDGCGESSRRRGRLVRIREKVFSGSSQI